MFDVVDSSIEMGLLSYEAHKGLGGIDQDIEEPKIIAVSHLQLQ